MMLLSLLAILFLVVFVLRTVEHSTAGIPNVTRPIDILRQRYAQGEIDSTEFHDRKRLLENQGKRSKD
jgi:putative membrane protein